MSKGKTMSKHHIKTIYLVGGTALASAGYDLLSFDRALAAAGIADLNHVRVSSIIPPHTTILKEPPPASRYPYGRIAYTVYSQIYGHPGDTITACLALIQTDSIDKRGVIFEISGLMNQTVAEQLATTSAWNALTDRSMVAGEKYILSKTLHIPEGKVGCCLVAAIMDFS